MKVNRVIVNIYYCLSALIIMFYYLFNAEIQNILLILVLFFAVLFSLTKKQSKYKIFPCDTAWLAYILIVLLRGLFTNNIIETIKGVGVYLICLINKIIMQSMDDTKFNILIKLLLLIGFVHAAAVIIQLFFPGFILTIDKKILSSSGYEIASHESEVYRSGITSQPGIAGYCTALYSMICFTYYICNKNKKYIVLYIIGVIALLLTGKRTLFVSSILIAILVRSTFLCKIKGEGFKFFKYLLVFVIIFLILYNFVPILHNNIERIFNTNLAGREYNYSVMINQFINHPLIGVGFRTNIYDFTAHNEYLSVLSSNGIVGFIPWIIAVIIPLLNSSIFILRNDVFLHDEFNAKNFEVHKLLLSISWQMVIVIYSLTGNCLSDKGQLFCYFIFAGMGIQSIKKLANSKFIKNNE